MNDESLEQVETRLAAMDPAGAPRELRGAVLADVRRELRASRWDRRLARVAAVLLVVGVGMNVAIGMKGSGEGSRGPHVAASQTQSLVDTAVVVAEATDARTGSQYARQLAEMIGHVLSDDEAAAIDAAVHYAPVSDANGKKG